MILPALRQDLQLNQVDAARDGSPRWILSDPITGHYFRLTTDALRLLKHWALRDSQRVLTAANQEPGLTLDESALEQLLKFLSQHDLIAPTEQQQRRSYSKKAASRHKQKWKSLLHQYLFFRIPLWRPDAMLEKCWPSLNRIGSPFLRYVLPLILILGLYLLGRHWSSYAYGFPHLFSFNGAASFAVALVFAKFLHELGHAFMAKRAGCRVHSMGLAFIVLFPLFYTDVSDAWKVKDRNARLLIGAGGILAELILAVIMLLVWFLLPEGPAKTAAFMLSGVTWVTTLVINLNPLMRFDGYYLLSDYWQVDNLQERAFALCRWQLREALFGYNQPAPESWPADMHWKLLLWGYASWLWRFFLFLGIALLVYHFFIKVIGISLMLVELGWFILLPIFREIHIWWTMRHASNLAHVLRTVTFIGILGLALLYPWQGRIQVPVMWEATSESVIYTPVAAQLKTRLIEDSQHVKKGDLLLELQSTDLDYRLRMTRQQLDILQLQRRREAGNQETVGNVRVMEQQLAEALARYRGLEAQKQLLQIRAPQDGVIRDITPGLTGDRWLAAEQPLFRIVSAEQSHFQGYLPEQYLQQTTADATGYFVANNPALPRFPVKLQSLSPTGVTSLTLESLSSDYGGPIAVRRDKQQQAIPLQGQYAVSFTLLESAMSPEYPLRGIVVMEGNKISLLASLWRQIAAIGIRESGF